MLLADVGRNVIQFFPARFVEINQLPFSLTHGAGGTDARALFAPQVRTVPIEASAFRGVAGLLEQGHEAHAVYGLRCLPAGNAGYFKDAGEIVFHDDVLVAAGIGLCHARPAYNHRFADAAFVGRAFSAGERGVLRVERFIPPSGAGGISSVVTAEQDDGIVRLPVLFQPVHEVAQALVHAFNERGIGCFLVRHSFLFVLVEEAHVLVDRDVDGIMRHVEVERLVVFLGFVEGFQCLLCQGFGDKGTCFPVFLQSRNRHERGGVTFLVVSVVQFTQIGSQPACRMAGNVRFKAEVAGVLSRSVDGSPVCLSAVDGVVAAIFQVLHERLGHEGVVRAFHLRNAVVVPVGKLQHLALGIGGFVLLQGPVGHPVAGGVGSGHQTAAGGRTDARGVGLREHHSLTGQTLHVRGFVTFVVHGFLCPERQ